MRPAAYFATQPRDDILIVHYPSEFWTGNAWTNVKSLARHYRLNAAREIIQRRFHRLVPHPKPIPLTWLRTTKKPDEYFMR